jgi:hypothetical protein
MGAVVNLMVSRKLMHMQKLLEIATMLVLKHDEESYQHQHT